MSQARPITGRKPAQGAAVARAAGPKLGLALLVIATAQLMVVLDATIVNVALPHIQRALGFSGSGLEWVVNAYALAFGGLMLLGGRPGDLLGRRKMFIAGLLVFSAASLVGGFATSQAWLLAARAVQGAGAAIVAPTALALITTTFREGKPRNRAMGVYAAMSVAGGAVGLIAGGLLTTYAVLAVGDVRQRARSGWRQPWPRRGCSASPRRQRGRFDLPGAITGTAGLAALVYGLTSAATSPNGVSHWGDAKVVASLAASAVLLTAFAVIETRSHHALLPLRLLADRNRTGANLIMLCVGTAIFGMFFFLTVFMQSVWGYSALKTGVAYLPLTAGIMVSSGAAAQLVAPDRCPAAAAGGSPRPRPAACTGCRGSASTAATPARCSARCWSSPSALGCCSCRSPWSPCPGSPTRNPGSRPACATPASRSAARSGWPCSAPSPGPSSPTASTPRPPTPPPPPPPAATRRGPARQSLTAIYHHALATGFSRAFLVAAGVMLLALIITIVAIRVRRADLGEARF